MILLVAACDTSTSTVTTADGGATIMELEPPALLLNSRTIDRGNLLLRVRVGDRTPLDTRAESSRNVSFQVTTLVPVGRETIISIEWYETGLADFVDPGLLLARASQSILVSAGSPGEAISFSSENFDTSIDSDNDGRSNLDERNDNTDPADASDPPEPVVIVPLAVRFVLPQIFAESDDAIIDQITAIGRINSQVIELSVENNIWSGSADVTENSETLISVTFVLASNTGIRLALREATESAGSGGTVTFNADTYDLDFNDDGDDFTNAVEVRDGTNPRNSSDPQTDACATGQFSQGCTTDTDNDGTPDSVEGSSADEDNDGRPDYLESSVVDADGDGSSAQADPREADPCIPTETNQACIDSQPPVDPCEGAQGDFTIGCTTDSDDDGEADSVEGATANGDGDTILDYLDPDNVDSDDDGTFDEFDADNADPCIPSTNSQPCIDLQPPPDPCEGAQGDFTTGCDTDTDGDGEPDSVEGPSANSDTDTILDYLDPDNIDSDSDGTVDELDDDNLDPCIPRTNNQACRDLQPPDDEPEPADPCDGARGDFTVGCTTDTDEDGKPDSVETFAADTDLDGEPDFEESAIEDNDEDLVVDELDRFDSNPCRPNADSPACEVDPTPVDDDDDDEGDEDDDDDGVVVILPPPPP